ncbi:MAG TPA: TIGR03663 family protein, partial [Aggregatilineales bacterium]|nr:TIGR03663 family protein [Aggregatilineales bacterium]
MTVREDTTTTGAAPLAGRWDRLEYELTRLLTINGEVIAYTVIFILAVLTRFWDLGVRVMSHDESLHTRYSWNLYRGEGFSHTPLMHGPLLFHMTALSYLLFGDTDFTSRIYPAVVGIIVVMMPVLMRKWLGKVGALAASFFFLISPLILYYSRYIRHDMPAIFGALIMAVSAWRYIEGRSFRYLIALAIGQAILYASKEVSFIYIAIFGSFLTLYFIARLLDVRW